MEQEDRTGKKGFKERLDEELHPPESDDARRERLALETLVSLLGSEDETTRLHAAQAILTRPKASPTTPGAAQLIQKLAKGT